MAKLFPTRQTFVDEKLSSGEQIVVSRVKIVSSSDVLELPVSLDAAILQSSTTASDPTFYFTDNNTAFNIDGATVGSEFVVVSRHAGLINHDPGDNPDGSA